MTLSFSKTDLLLTAIPLLLIIPVLAHGQQEQGQQGAPINQEQQIFRCCGITFVNISKAIQHYLTHYRGSK